MAKTKYIKLEIHDQMGVLAIITCPEFMVASMIAECEREGMSVVVLGEAPEPTDEPISNDNKNKLIGLEP